VINLDLEAGSSLISCGMRITTRSAYKVEEEGGGGEEKLKGGANVFYEMGP